MEIILSIIKGIIDMGNCIHLLIIYKITFPAGTYKYCYEPLFYANDADGKNQEFKSAIGKKNDISDFLCFIIFLILSFREGDSRSSMSV